MAPVDPLNAGGDEPPANVQVLTPLQSIGTSPKAWLAGLLPQITALFTIGITYLVMGTIDKLALVAALVQVGSGLVAGLAAWLARPGKVEVAVQHPDSTQMGVGARAEALTDTKPGAAEPPGDGSKGAGGAGV